MIPRYLPSIDLAARLRASRVEAGAANRLVASLAPGHAFDEIVAVAALRDGLNAYFSNLAARAGSGEILISAQCCPLVALSASSAGFMPRFVDIADDRPAPTGRQFADAIGPSVKGVVVAPFYGHLGESLETMLTALGDRSLLLDLAQGLGLRTLDPLLRRADAVGWSFGIGKGLDTGGGLLLTRAPLSLSGARHAALGAGALMRSAGLRVFAACGLYRIVAKVVERAAEAGPDDFDPHVHLIEGDWIYKWWHLRLPVFLEEVEVARRRASSLASRVGAHPAFAYAPASFSPDATHLRQIIRLTDAHARDATLGRLQRSGIDCARAGEPLPSEYVRDDRGDYPAAKRFLADAIRLPFLGRLSERQFSYLSDTLERALA
jgi:dTDP-4-amino-4,6-dideoxygalactose transaminase